MLEFNYHNILVGVDGSKTAAKAVKKAIAVAHRNSAKLFIVAVINNRDFIGVSKSASIGFGNIDPSTIESLKENFEKLVNGYAKQAKDAGLTSVEAFVTFGDPKTELATEIVADKKIDAIVIGATGVNFFTRLTLGSTAAFVIAHAPCDVFIVHRPKKGDHD
ncbi:universal stress protein [Lentilactobacillus hilgardii]|uniref:Universal stress protein n=1 Tax=Lentilactobacillus hilgardii (strain ATCC 8290 / DSM 20176 / CCUG 30140 / JCM 1155 / KCTC 3500 / NBRC 15886 / NCIMB 8040 / NRRL B-1843 / 9) TaxID=1423757 RepID=C0XMI9_LENH9|nr:universal stress protein [Lentilactobacillus hilgardii]EEI18424.1 universal stress family protein [Lentilactobacillus buchneri ATCC 11577]EEI23407.1 universal stress family protein [Lentilactobacillus hilgardii DSM 20176 = ATCC 8290]KRK58342.1 universal stress protein UspA [Lentilactobacillus hilgardii DSM 20176 = ATCC 8290]MCP9333054.1 universal stress protein [Lentilactobacillus hilgardii]MCP9349683.1 universal stress protein [Lentilactobacillus hilgardii]